MAHRVGATLSSRVPRTARGSGYWCRPHPARARAAFKAAGACLVLTKPLRWVEDLAPILLALGLGHGASGSTAKYRVYTPVGGAPGAPPRAVLALTVDIGALLASAAGAGSFEDVAISVVGSRGTGLSGAAPLYSRGVASGPRSLVQPVTALLSVLGVNLTIRIAPGAAFVEAYSSSRASSTALRMTFYPVCARAAQACCAGMRGRCTRHILYSFVFVLVFHAALRLHAALCRNDTLCSALRPPQARDSGAGSRHRGCKQDARPPDAVHMPRTEVRVCVYTRSRSLGFPSRVCNSLD
jgi:hypothetical protein